MGIKCTKKTKRFSIISWIKVSFQKRKLFDKRKPKHTNLKHELWERVVWVSFWPRKNLYIILLGMRYWSQTGELIADFVKFGGNGRCMFHHPSDIPTQKKLRYKKKTESSKNANFQKLSDTTHFFCRYSLCKLIDMLHTTIPHATYHTCIYLPTSSLPPTALPPIDL